MYEGDCILAINGGSSGIKFSLYKIEHLPRLVLNGQVENTGTQQTTIRFTNSINQQDSKIEFKAAGQNEVVGKLVEYLEQLKEAYPVKAIGHRIVHGMARTGPALVTPALISELKSIIDYDPEHLPREIELIDLFGKHYPAVKQVVCFDTAFHRSMPAVATMLPIPRRYFEKGIKRYGFHGLSYAYLMEELEKDAAPAVSKGKIILAHLGSGVSLAAVKDGKSIDTSMGFTPASGLMMSTRTGDLDPGVASYLMKTENLSPEAFSHLVNHESGLLGVSGISSDIRQVIEAEHVDHRAAEAIELFCYQVKKCIGSFAAVLGGLDTLVFTGGIGEHSPLIRSRICDGLAFLGIELDETRNNKNEKIISTGTHKVSVHVTRTNEEIMIVRSVLKLINK